MGTYYAMRFFVQNVFNMKPAFLTFYNARAENGDSL